ncbi:hypothetical protein [Nocardioides convexus]|uniref:hypothetical protein n=1 Tax=Nocardioides convexus TaxID=2712224 RepID=UPI002418181D|nr:hypothetical protein [Nocardioides convexus]
MLIVPFVAVAVWLVLWRAKFSAIENVLGLMGLALIAFAVALWQARPGLGRPGPHPVARGEARAREPGRPTPTSPSRCSVPR